MTKEIGLSLENPLTREDLQTNLTNSNLFKIAQLLNDFRLVHKMCQFCLGFFLKKYLLP